MKTKRTKTETAAVAEPMTVAQVDGWNEREAAQAVRDDHTAANTRPAPLPSGRAVVYQIKAIADTAAGTDTQGRAAALAQIDRVARGFWKRGERDNAAGCIYRVSQTLKVAAERGPDVHPEALSRIHREAAGYFHAKHA